jgi:2-aminoethylphosphonate-pyruvate transaminase
MKLLIPGPVTTNPAVRAAAAADFAPWDNDFRPMNVDIRARVLRIAGTDDTAHATLPLQGCGHFAVEAALRTFVPEGGRVLVPATGAYADRAIRLGREIGLDVATIPVPETGRADPATLRAGLAADPAISHAVLVYSETGSGIVHDVPALAAAAGQEGRRVIVDAVSAFGAMPLDLASLPMVDAAVFTANKCLEGLPGLAFAVARIDRLLACRGQARSWSLDLADIYQHALRVGWGSFRFTPPAQVLAAFQKALDLYDAEGGQPARLGRYAANMSVLYDGVRRLGLRPYLPPEVQGPIVVNIHAPQHPRWSLQGFVDALKPRGFLISNFYNTAAPSFRVGCIGAITPDDMHGFVAAMDGALHELGITLAEAA